MFMRQTSTFSDWEREEQLEDEVLEFALHLARACNSDGPSAFYMLPRMRRLAPGFESCSDRISGASRPGSIQLPVLTKYATRRNAMGSGLGFAYVAGLSPAQQRQTAAALASECVHGVLSE